MGGRRDLDLDEAGETRVPAVDGRDVDVDAHVRVGVVEAVVAGEVAGRGLGISLGAQDVSRPGQGRGVGSVLLIAPLDEHHADVERERGDDEQRDEAAGKEHEDLPAFAGAV